MTGSRTEIVSALPELSGSDARIRHLRGLTLAICAVFCTAGSALAGTASSGSLSYSMWTLVARASGPAALAGGAGDARIYLAQSEVTYPPDTIPRPPTVTTPGIPNPPDNVVISIPGSGGTGGAAQVLTRVDRYGKSLNSSAGACSTSAGDVGRYLACMSDALNAFANQLDQITSQLPPGMKNVARIVNDARGEIDRLRSDAARRLARASTDAEREQIRRETLTAAAKAMSDAAGKIRKTITLVRAEDPELASIQRQTVITVADAVDNVGIKLTRAVGL